MAYSEIDIFVEKFKHLWHAGIQASLNVETENGRASVILKTKLGFIPPPPPLHGRNNRQHRGQLMNNIRNGVVKQLRQFLEMHQRKLRKKMMIWLAMLLMINPKKMMN